MRKFLIILNGLFKNEVLSKKERIRLLYLIFFVILIDVIIVDYIFVFLISIFNWICISEIFVCVVNISFVIFVGLMVGVIMLVCKNKII